MHSFSIFIVAALSSLIAANLENSSSGLIFRDESGNPIQFPIGAGLIGEDGQPILTPPTLADAINARTEHELRRKSRSAHKN